MPHGLSVCPLHQACELLLAEEIPPAAALTYHIGPGLILKHPGQFLPAKGGGQLPVNPLKNGGREKEIP